MGNNFVHSIWFRLRPMVFNATFNNISGLSWLPLHTKNESNQDMLLKKYQQTFHKNLAKTNFQYDCHFYLRMAYNI